MTTIYKYVVPQTDYPIVHLPKGARILTVGNQDVKLYLWAVVDSEQKETEVRKFRIFGTGHPIVKQSGEFKFLNTVFMPNGLVWHVFEDVK